MPQVERRVGAHIPALKAHKKAEGDISRGNSLFTKNMVWSLIQVLVEDVFVYPELDASDRLFWAFDGQSI